MRELATVPAHAVAPDSPLYDQALRGGERIDTLAPISSGTRADTVWFGGDNGNGIAFEGGIWDWDTIVSDPFQGWTSVDMTDDPDIYFQWANADSFIVHGGFLHPCFPDSSALLWCGIHEDEADERDFIGGMGYQNNMCQRAFSPEFSIEPAGHSIAIDFMYFNDSELDCDCTYIYVLCYDETDELIEEYQVDCLHGIIGSPYDPAIYTAMLAAGTLNPATATVQVEFRMESNGGHSDEDGQWNTECGPFGADNVGITVGASGEFYDFNDGPQGWTFAKCEGIGTFMAVVPEGLWSEWTDHAGVTCECGLDGNAVSFVDLEGSSFWPPGHTVGQYERAISAVVPRSGYEPPAYNHTLCEWDHYVYLRRSAGTFYRPGYMFYPYTTEMNPEPHWSSRMGQDVWHYTGDTPGCYLTGASFSSPPDGTPMPAEWDSMRAVYEIVTSCPMFMIPPDLCQYEGETWGSPVIDNFRVGLTYYSPDAPPIALETGHHFMDGFGQRFPFYIEPSDVGNANISYDHSRNNEGQNDWLSDTALVVGPGVGGEDERWLVELCFQLTRVGPRQEMIPGYHEWKARFIGDPEECFVCARLDSFENPQGVWPHKYHTYFHEDDPGFDPNYPDLTPEQEILRDSLFTPGTRIEYYYRSYWYNGGAPPEEYGIIGPWEFEILPGMRACGGGYDFEYPCVLYIDAYNRGSEYYIVPMLEQLGLQFDIYDALDSSASWEAPMKRSFGGTHFNPGGWGNNGCTEDQLLGYRLILVNTGVFGLGCWEHNGSGHGTGIVGPNFELFQGWLESNECGLEARRRGLIMNGDGIAVIMDDQHADFLNNTLGVTFEAESYREYNNDWEYCVYLEPTPEAVFQSVFPYVSLYGNGCPNFYDYNVLGIHGGVPGVTGNLRYHRYQGTGDEPYVEYAQVVRENVQPDVANWESVVDGFSLHHLAERGFGGEDCSSDSASVVSGGLDLLIPELLGWMTDPDDPFDPWRYPCTDTGVDEESESHLSGPVTYLFPSRPSPFMRAATIRFSLASSDEVSLSIYDVSGRLVRRLVDGEMDAGEHSAVWDRADDHGRRVGAGVFWMQLATHTGYRSSKRLLVLR